MHPSLGPARHRARPIRPKVQGNDPTFQGKRPLIRRFQNWNPMSLKNISSLYMDGILAIDSASGRDGTTLAQIGARPKRARRRGTQRLMQANQRPCLDALNS